MREPGRRRTDVLGGVLHEQTADHPFVVSYQLKNGKTSTRTYSGHAADEDIRAVLEAIPDAADAIAAAADMRP